MYDVIISGSGPAGIKCSEVLARNGFKVALIERDANWRKPCGGAVSSRVFKYFPQLRRLDFPHIYGITMYSGDYHKLKYSWKGTRDYSIVVDRLEFDNLIRNIAVDAGVELFDGNLSFDFISKDKKRIGIKTKTSSGEKEYFGKILIIADGMSSKLAIKSGLRSKWKTKELGLVKCEILEGTNSLEEEYMSIFFRSYKGYGWIFPLGKNRFNIGCGTFEEDNFNYNLNQIYHEFRNDPHIKQILSGSSFKQIWSGAYPLPGIGVNEKSLYGDNLMIIGDAAGFVSPISGEGIHPGIVSGNIAAETAINALESEDTSQQMLKSYKSNVYIKKIIRNFKLKRQMVEFFYKQEGKNLSKMLELAEKDQKFRDTVINMFLFNAIPSKEFLSMIRN